MRNSALPCSPPSYGSHVLTGWELPRAGPRVVAGVLAAFAVWPWCYPPVALSPYALIPTDEMRGFSAI